MMKDASKQKNVGKPPKSSRVTPGKNSEKMKANIASKKGLDSVKSGNRKSDAPVSFAARSDSKDSPSKVVEGIESPNSSDGVMRLGNASSASNATKKSMISKMSHRSKMSKV